MEPTRSRNTFVAAILVVALAVAGCTAGSSDSTATASGNEFAVATERASSSDGATTVTSSENSSSEGAQAATTENQESHATADDLDYDRSAAVEISLHGDTASSDPGDVTIEGSSITITSDGVYSLSGTLTDGGWQATSSSRRGRFQ